MTGSASLPAIVTVAEDGPASSQPSGLDRSTVKVSSGSTSVSSRIATSRVTLVSPGTNTTIAESGS